MLWVEVELSASWPGTGWLRYNLTGSLHRWWENCILCWFFWLITSVL